MRSSWKFLLPLLASTLCFAQQPDRLAGAIDSSQVVALAGNVNGQAQPRFDLGRVDGGKALYGVTLAFRPSPAQQAELDTLLAQQQDRSSANYRKWLTPAQFANRFGMTRNDIGRVATWLQSQGFTVTGIANSRNQVSFNGTVAQVETTFHTEIHNYQVDGELHFANATNPSVPASLAGIVLMVGHLHDFNPKARAKIHAQSSNPVADPHFTSAQTGEHFLTPGDFETIYNVPTNLDATGQTIAVIGQSKVNPSDLANFRNAAGLAAKAPQYILYPTTSTATRCAGDEGESDLDLEWSNGVASNANVIFVYAGLLSGDTCGNRTYSIWDALQQTVDNNYAPIISTSYGFCESGLGNSFALEVQGWAQQANAQGQTIMASSGDAGAADCDTIGSESATQGLAVDVPAAIPEVTASGGNEFTGDADGTVSAGNAAATQYWSGTTSGADTISSALSYIPEMAWNDTVENDGLAASGGGSSIYFTKPTWQTGVGVPVADHRYVPDIALNASPYHDPYLICSEDGKNGTVVDTCTSGFRTGAGGDLTVVGGTSCVAPSFSAIVALLNQSMSSNGLGNINPTLYSLVVSNPTAFHDVTTGNNIVPCTNGTTDCPAVSPFQYGYSAGTGYDEVTGLGSVNATVLFAAWPNSRTSSSIVLTSSASSVSPGAGVTFTAVVTPTTSVGTVSFSTLNNAVTTVLGTATLNVPYSVSNPYTGTATFNTTALPGGLNAVTATYEGDTADNSSVSASTSVNVVVPFSLTPSPTSSTIPAGQSAAYTITVAPLNGFTGTVNFTNSTVSNPGSCTAGLPAGALCSFSPGGVTFNGSASQNVTLTITTAANMAPLSAQAITVTGTSGSTTVPTTVNLTLTATNETFTLTTTATTFPVTVGGSVPVNLTVNGTNGFVVGSGAGATTALPLTYSCSSSTPPLATAEISCTFSPSNGQAVSATAVALSFVTTAPTAQAIPPLGGSRIFYALLLPGLFGIVLAAGSRTRGARLLGLIVVLGFSTLGLGSCSSGGGSGTTTPPNQGTPAGAYQVTISATSGAPAGGTAVSSSLVVTLNVSAQ